MKSVHLSIRCALAQGALLAAIAAPASAQVYDKTGDESFDRFGWSVTKLGDVNADGHPDFAAGAVENGQLFASEEGFVRVFSGSTGAVLYTFTGDFVFDEFGGAVGDAGDVNLDGHADILVGAPAYSSGFLGTGQVKVLSGANGSTIHNILGELEGMNLGAAVAGLGDINGDGRSDFAASAPFANNNLGLVRVYSGLTGGVLHTLTGSAVANSRFGISLSRVDDVNGDGVSDIVVGTRNDGVYVFSGATGAQLYRVAPPVSTDLFGTSVASIGDVDGDGRGDFVVGATQDLVLTQGAGYAQVRSGATGAFLFQVDGSQAGDRLGLSVTGVGDWDADGKNDFAVGADQRDNAGFGYVRVFSGLDGSQLDAFVGIADGQKFGHSVAGLGDIDGNGRLELAIGNPDAPVGAGVRVGRVLVYAGPIPGTCVPPTTYCTTSPNQVGSGALISYSGSNSVAANNLTLIATGCPQNQFGLFYRGQSAIAVPFGNGVRCVGGPLVYRMPVVNTGIGGIGVSQVNVSPPGQPGQAILAGQTWRFQFWYRETGATFNFSNALTVQFCQ